MKKKENFVQYPRGFEEDEEIFPIQAEEDS